MTTGGNLKAKNILLGVCGGIAAYKSPAIVRRLRERGAEVQPVLTAGAHHFVTPLSLQAVAGRAVRDSLWDEAAEAAMGHIELARWADIVLIAPVSANTLARLACGAADDLLTTLVLATESPVMLAPAMNRVMWANLATQSNIATLRSRGMEFLAPGEGDQACGETGTGRMPEPDEIADWVEASCGNGALLGRQVLITAGPTREAVDPVRYISNHSSGKMGFAVAAAAAAAGAQVTLIAGPVQLPTPARVRRIDVETADEMLRAVEGEVTSADIFIATAAVADYRPATVATSKIKKSGDPAQLDMEATVDILARVAAREDAPFTVGFAAETDDVERYARGKLERKGLDMIAANQVGGGLAFGCDDNALTVLWHGGGAELARAAKTALARELIALIAQRLPSD